MTEKMKVLCGQVILEAAMESVRRKKSGGVPSGPGDVRRQMAQNLGNLWDGCQGEKEAEQIYGNVLPEAARRAGRMTEGYSRNPEILEIRRERIMTEMVGWMIAAKMEALHEKTIQTKNG